jgi:hypothetical protein
MPAAIMSAAEATGFDASMLFSLQAVIEKPKMALRSTTRAIFIISNTFFLWVKNLTITKC